VTGSDPRPLAGARWLKAPESRQVLDALQAGGRPARFVGGCVRDTLLDPDLDPSDLDLATAEPPERSMALLRAAGIHVVPTGIDHGTVTAQIGRHGFEITTLRRDVATFGRHAEVAFSDDFVEDAGRRDFTINAMSCDGDGRLFDPFDGHADLHDGRVRFVGEAVRRIREDYLRILRWFRFLARFGRGAPDAEALAACAGEAAGIAILSGERLQKELLALLRLKGAPEAVALMKLTGVLGHVLPQPAEPAALARLAGVGAGGDAILGLAAMLRAAGCGNAGPVADRLRLSRSDETRLQRLVSAALPELDVDLAAHRRAIDVVGNPTYADLLKLRAAEDGVPADRLRALLEPLAEWTPPAFPVSGNDLVAAGIAPGPELGRTLAALRAWWRERDFRPDRAALLARLAARG
jgi:poly(A) polymerase